MSRASTNASATGAQPSPFNETFIDIETARPPKPPMIVYCDCGLCSDSPAKPQESLPEHSGRITLRVSAGFRKESLRNPELTFPDICRFCCVRDFGPLLEAAARFVCGYFSRKRAALWNKSRGDGKKPSL
jgi:hypothetical protein